MSCPFLQFESQDSRELKQIFEGQSHIHGTIRELNRKLDEVIGRQERTLSSISMMGTGVAPSGQQVSRTMLCSLLVKGMSIQIICFFKVEIALELNYTPILNCIYLYM